uniref:Uncharacterized protein n=1 Tax=Ascaris lumbricoides TaxID=6252 RepID=A0A9J2PJG4_ASCLU
METKTPHRTPRKRFSSCSLRQPQGLSSIGQVRPVPSARLVTQAVRTAGMAPAPRRGQFGRPSTPRGRISRHRSSSPNHNHEVHSSNLHMSASMSASLGGTSMAASQHTMVTTAPNSTGEAQQTLPTHTPQTSNRLAVPGAAQEISSSQMSSNDRSLVPDTKTLHTTFAPTYVPTDNVEMSPVTATQFSEAHNHHSEDVNTKLNHKDAHICAGSVQATSTSAFKEQVLHSSISIYFVLFYFC